MRLEDLKGLKKADKIDKIRFYYDSIEPAAVKKLSMDASHDVRSLIALKCTDSSILHDMLKDRKNWNRESIIHNILTSRSLTLDDRLDFLRSQLWLETSFSISVSAKTAIFKNFQMPDKRVIDALLDVMKTAPNSIPHGMISSGLWYASTREEILDAISLFRPEMSYMYVDLFEIGSVQDLLTIEDKRKVILDNISIFKKYTNYLPQEVFKVIINDDILDNVIDINALTSKSIENILNNKSLGKDTHDKFFNNLVERIKIVSTTELGIILEHLHLDKPKTDFFIDYIDTHIKSSLNMVTSVTYSFLRNKTITSDTIKRLLNLKFDHSFNRPNALKILANNESISDTDLDTYVYLISNQMSATVIELKRIMFANLLLDKKIPRDSLIKTIWDHLKTLTVYKTDMIRTVSETSGPEIFVMFFESSPGRQTVLDKDLRAKCGYEYFKSNKVKDWLTYSDSLTEDQTDEIWDLTVNHKHDKMLVTALRKDILKGKYKDKFGVLYFEETGDESYLPEITKDIFIF